MSDDIISVRVMPWPEALADARRIREAVFVAEQGVPIELEWDEMDPVSEHALAFDSAGTALGTGRLLPDGHIGRMAVLAAARGRGVGGAILNALIERAALRGVREVALNAQTHATDFYRRYGFVAAGGVFMEAGIPHVSMTRTLR
jgi:hypothetical protein